jgi:hypothetical protein
MKETVSGTAWPPEKAYFRTIRIIEPPANSRKKRRVRIETIWCREPRSQPLPAVRASVVARVAGPFSGPGCSLQKILKYIESISGTTAKKKVNLQKAIDV